MSLKSVALFALATGFASITDAQAPASGTGTTTRYWDCCKPSCAWSGKSTAINAPVAQCAADGSPLKQGDDTQASGCDGGTSYMCQDQTPWAVSDTVAYGFAAAFIGSTEQDLCCSCYELTFTDSTLSTSGKKMVVQVTNTGSDLGSNQFDLAIPGGGVGIFNGCSKQYPDATLGAQYGGISSESQCSSWGAISSGCDFRFDWFAGADNPSVSYTRVACPAALTAKSQCKRDDEAGLPAAPSGSGASPASSSSAAAASSSAAPVASSSSYQASAPASSSSAAPVQSSATAAPSSSSAQQPSSSYVAPSSSVTAGASSTATVTLSSSSAPAAYGTSSSAAAEATAPAGPACPVQYVYQYDL